MTVKKTLLIVSGLFALSLVVLIFIQVNPNCYNNIQCDKLMNPVYEYRDYLVVLIETFFFFFFFSCITYFLRKEVYRNWLVLGIIYIPVSVVWSFNTPIQTGNFLINSGPSTTTDSTELSRRATNQSLNTPSSSALSKLTGAVMGEPRPKLGQ